MTNNKSCKLASKLASNAFERRLSFTEWFRMRLHLLLCQSCRNCEEEIHLLHDVLSLIRKNHGMFEVDLPQKDRELIRDALRDIARE